MSLVRNIEFLKTLPRMEDFRSLGGIAEAHGRGSSGRLTETLKFGDNPGNLRMFSFLPDTMPRRPALVVVMHGCTQKAGAYDLGAGWSTLAQRYGFALLMPQQKQSNNANLCFNWFQPDDTARGSGEAASVRQMIEQMAVAHGIDRRRIFVTGLSAGGAMTSVMLATYPEVFAGGAIIAGLPYGAANSLQQALSGMHQTQQKPAHELGDLVRAASEHRGPWPKISVWHGSADRTVNPANADGIVSQWLNVHGLPPTPMFEDSINGYPRQGWWNGNGETVIESYTITNMAHGTPLGIADNDERYGVAGAFLIDAGISSSYHIAKFWGLTGTLRNPAGAPADPIALPPAATLERDSERQNAKPIKTGRSATAAPEGARGRASPIDVNAVITRALTAAGLIK